MQNKKNPFSISKAVDLTNQEVKDMWVDSIDFERFIEPSSLKPKMIIGGKGTGKTHLMRYFSHNVQLQDNDIKTIIKRDKYLCVYIPSEILQSCKFSPIDDTEKSRVIFTYYFGLFVFNTYLVPLLKKIIASYNQNTEYFIVGKIKKLFDIDFLSGDTLKKIQEEIQIEIKSINYLVNNYSFKPEGINDIKVSIDADALFFGVPKIIKETLEDDNIVINYFIDEFESFAPEQQKYIQSLARDSGDKCTFRLGIRSHAYNPSMLQTVKVDEPNKIGSEIEKVVLDDWLIENDNKYKNFIIKIIQHRIDKQDNNNFKQCFSKLFSVPSTDEELSSESSFKKLKTNTKAMEEAVAKLKVTNNNTEYSDALLEKVNVYFLYKELKKKQAKNRGMVFTKIQQKCNLYLKNPTAKNDYRKVLKKQKDNLMAQLYKENKKDNPIYFGLDNLIKISNHNPRHFINFMAHLYNYADYFDENVEQGFSVKIQKLALDKTHNWFENDYYKDGMHGDKQILFSDKICRYLEAIRLSPKPIDTSVLKFYITDENYLDFERQLTILCGNRIIIQRNDRPSKQLASHNKDKMFQINLIYAKKYTLPISSRGTVEFNKKILKAIFIYNERKYSEFITKTQKKWIADETSTGQQEIF